MNIYAIKDRIGLKSCLRRVQVFQLLTLLAVPLPILFSLTYAKGYFRGFEAFGPSILSLILECAVTIVSVSLIFAVSRIKDGPDENDRLRFFFWSGLATFLIFFLAPVMLFVLFYAVLGLGVYNIIVAEREIRKLKETSNETDISV